MGLKGHISTRGEAECGKNKEEIRVLRLFFLFSDFSARVFENHWTYYFFSSKPENEPNFVKHQVSFVIKKWQELQAGKTKKSVAEIFYVLVDNEAVFGSLLVMMFFLSGHTIQKQ